MKYWRGYLIAAIMFLLTWGLVLFAQSHWVLVDMVYPYVTRIVQNFLANWSSGLDFCLWQLILIVMGVVALSSIVMMIIWKWNIFQWFGWVAATVSVVFFLNTAIFGLNNYAGPIADDLLLDVSDYTVSELEQAGQFYLEQANALSSKVSRDSDGQVQFPAFQDLAVLAAQGFENQTYDHFNAVFAGSTLPVKELGWSNYMSRKGIAGIAVGLTGEAAVNPETPAVAMPFVICRVMAQRMCITHPQDAAFAAFLACDANPTPEFRYSGYLMAYNHCYQSLKAMDVSAAQASASKLAGKESISVKKDLETYNASFAANDGLGDSDLLKFPEFPDFSDNPKLPDLQIFSKGANEPVVRSSMTDLLVNWHIQQYILPTQVEEEVVFDPKDESQVFKDASEEAQ